MRSIRYLLTTLLIDLPVGTISTWVATPILTACPHPFDARLGSSHFRILSILDY